MAGSFFDLAVLFLAKIFGFGAVFWYISTHIFRNELPLWVVNHAYGMGFALGLAGMLTYRVLIYPTFLDPLRFLPRPDVSIQLRHTFRNIIMSLHSRANEKPLLGWCKFWLGYPDRDASGNNTVKMDKRIPRCRYHQHKRASGTK